jgi:hypothetical protein
MLQGECALDAENIVKLFTMDMVDQQKVEEYVYEMALQVMIHCLALSAPCGSSLGSQLRLQQGSGVAVSAGGARCGQQRIGGSSSSSSSPQRQHAISGTEEVGHAGCQAMVLAGDSMQRKHPPCIQQQRTGCCWHTDKIS